MFARLFRQFIVRRLGTDRLRTATTIAGVALGIAVVIAIQLTNRSSVAGFETALEVTAGRTSVEIVGPGTGIDETRFADLTWLRDFGVASPIVEGDMAVITGENRTEAMRVLGVDILRDRPLRDYRLGVGSGGSSGSTGSSGSSGSTGSSGSSGSTEALSATRFLELLTSPRAIVLTEVFARRHGLSVGSDVRLISGDRVLTYTVTALLADEGPAKVLDGNFALMDIAAAQLAFDRLGRIDRIDVRLEDGEDVGEAVAAIGARLPEGLSAQRPARRGAQVERMLAAFHMNLTALSWIALIVGLFLVYNTVTISVIARREEIGTLRALGVTRRQVLSLFLGEAAAMGLAGTALGLGLARVLADAAVALTSTTVQAIYIASAAAPPDLGWGDVELAFAIGLPLSLIAAAVPAREAASVPPTAAIRGSDRLETRVRFSAARLIAPALLLALAGGLATLGPIDGVPVFGYTSAFTTIIGVSLLVPAIIFLVARVTRPWLRRIAGVEGLLAHANLAASIPRLAISVAALATALSMLVAIAVMIGSFRDTVAYWVNQTLQADLFIGPGVQTGRNTSHTLSEDIVQLLKRHPQIDAVDSFSGVDLAYGDGLVVLGAGDFEVAATRAPLLFKAPADGRDRMLGAVGRDQVIVSEPFVNRYGLGVGDTLRLDTPAGPRDFAIVAEYYDYAADRGTVVMDRATFTRYFGARAPSAIRVYVSPGADPAAVRQSILDEIGEGHRLFIYTNRSLRDEVLRIFDSTFAITYALEVIAIVVAMLGVAGTLLTLVLERREELALVRLVGAGRRQVQRMVVLEAAMIGAISQGIGLAVGLALSLLLIFVINVQSFGWTIQFHLPIGFLAQVTVAVVVFTALAGLYPAKRATAMGTLREE
ncbi:MAG: FtsX-like permease family protein [Vicinamibacterales bacterium]